MPTTTTKPSSKFLSFPGATQLVQKPSMGAGGDQSGEVRPDPKGTNKCVILFILNKLLLKGGLKRKKKTLHLRYVYYFSPKDKISSYSLFCWQTCQMYLHFCVKKQTADKIDVM